MKPWKSDAKPDQPAPKGNGDLGMVVSMDFLWLCSIIKGRSKRSAHACFQEVAIVLAAF